MAPLFSDSIWGSTARMVFRAPAQIHRQITVPHLIGDVLKLGLTSDTGVVDQHCHRAQGGLRLPDHVRHGGTVRHIRLDGDGIAALRPQGISHLPAAAWLFR